MIVVGARLHGPADPGTFRLALDTGATYTMLSRAAFDSLGYHEADLGEPVDILAIGGQVRGRRVSVASFAALGLRRESFPVVVLPLDRRARIDGLLGLDFVRDSRITIDFRRGEIELEAGP